MIITGKMWLRSGLTASATTMGGCRRIDPPSGHHGMFWAVAIALGGAMTVWAVVISGMVG